MTENRKRVPDFFGRLYPDDLQRGSFLGTWVRRAEVDELLDEIQQLRSTLSLAEEGLANYAQENESLKHRCDALAYLHYGHYLVQRDRHSVQADIQACESALTALRRELAALPQSEKQT
jgi:cell division septum initiation protein DivIVA